MFSHDSTSTPETDGRPVYWITARVITKRLPKGIRVDHTITTHKETLSFVFDPGGARDFRNRMITRGIGTESTPLAQLCHDLIVREVEGRIK